MRLSRRLACLLIVLVGVLGGCVEPASINCPNGLVCPDNSRCAANQDICIFDDCGDMVVQSPEVCDDGNVEAGDGCSANCRSNETCGNDTVDLSKGEVCDDGNTSDTDGCSADCKSNEDCGNGTTDT